MIDCANDYDNEHVIGEAFQELFKEGVVVRYSKYFYCHSLNSDIYNNIFKLYCPTFM